MGQKGKKTQTSWDFRKLMEDPEERRHFQALGEALQDSAVMAAVRYYIAVKLGHAAKVLGAPETPDLVYQNRLMQASGATQLLKDHEKTLIKVAEGYPEFMEYQKNLMDAES